MANPEEKFNALMETLTHNPEIKQGYMFGFKSITVKSKTFALLDRDGMVFKLRGETHTEALDLDDAKLWNPFGHKKKEWVQVSFEHSSLWEKFSQSARDYVESLIKVPS